MFVIWSQLLGMKFSRRAEFKSIHSFLNPVLRNGTFDSMVKSLEHSRVEAHKKRGGSVAGPTPRVAV